MAMTGLMIIGSAFLVMTMPAEMQAPAQAIVGLQGMAYITIALFRGIAFVIAERATLKQMIRDITGA
jgi:hypothetical protein